MHEQLSVLIATYPMCIDPIAFTLGDFACFATAAKKNSLFGGYIAAGSERSRNQCRKNTMVAYTFALFCSWRLDYRALMGHMLKNSLACDQKRSRTMIVMDGGWAHANTSKLSKRYVLEHLREALGTEERFAVLDLAEPGGVVWKSPQDQIAFFENWDPKPVELDPKRAQQALAQMAETTFDSLWLSDGLAHANIAKTYWSNC